MYKKLYLTNENFKKYVDKYANEYRISVDEALRHKIVHEAGDMYKEIGGMGNDSKNSKTLA